MKTTFRFIFNLLVFLFMQGIFVLKAFAICPVCTIAVAGGVGLSRYLGIDDTISGLWIGALIVSTIMWTINWLAKRKIRFFGDKVWITIGYYAITVVPLYWTNLMGHPLNKIWGIDKLTIGIIIGSLVFFTGAMTYYYLKAKNKGRANFPFQKVVMPVAPLIILSLIFYFLTKG